MYFREYGELWKKVWGTSLLPQVVLIYSIKPILSCISLRSYYLSSYYWGSLNLREIIWLLDVVKLRLIQWPIQDGEHGPHA